MSFVYTNPTSFPQIHQFNLFSILEIELNFNFNFTTRNPQLFPRNDYTIIYFILILKVNKLIC